MGAYPKGLADIRQGTPKSRLRLFAPLRYLFIINSEKSRYDFVYPALIGIAVWLFCIFITPRVALFGDSGLIKYTRDMLVMAVPFAIGALATVAMGSPGQYLDRRPIGVELFLDGYSLTLRQFVCHLLGYLCFVALLTLGATIVAELMRPAIIHLIGSEDTIRFVVRSMGSFVLFLALSSLIVTILWALYFLTEVINHPSGNGS